MFSSVWSASLMDTVKGTPNFSHFNVTVLEVGFKSSKSNSSASLFSASGGEQRGARIRFRRFEADLEYGHVEVGEVGCSFHSVHQRRGPDAGKHPGAVKGSWSVYLASFGRRSAILFDQKD